MNNILKVIEEGEKEFRNKIGQSFATGGFCTTDIDGDWELDIKCIESFQKEQAIKLLEAVNDMVNGHKRTNTYEEDLEATIFEETIEEISSLLTSTINQIKEK